MNFLLLISLSITTLLFSEDKDLSLAARAIISRACNNNNQFSCKTSRLNNGDERVVAFNRRVGVAERETILKPANPIELEGNGDEFKVPDFAANFSKTLEHDPITGLLTLSGEENYKKLLKALRTGKQDDFNAINRAPDASIKFVNPQAAFAFSLEGMDTSLFKMPIFPNLSSPQAAALMIEDYLMMLTRDVSFSDYGTSMGTDFDNKLPYKSKTKTAASILDSLGLAYTGPRNGGRVDYKVLFRGNSQGDLIGPYISQFLLVPFKIPVPNNIGGNIFSNPPFSSFFIDQLRPIASKREFEVSFQDFVKNQNGQIPQIYNSSDFDATQKRYVINGRDLGNFVHFDSPYEAYYDALNILISRNAPLSPVLPYANGNIKNEVPFATMGGPDVYALVGGVAGEAFKAAWTQKWRAHRALRPEAFGGLIHRVKVTGQNPFNLHSSIFSIYKIGNMNVNLLDLVLKKNQEQAFLPNATLSFSEASTYLFSQMFPEGCPAHPTYPSGHATAAGACTTVIKAIFNDQFKIKDLFTPQTVNPNNQEELIDLADGSESIMTIGSELDKVASNVAFGRNFAGVHYRSDCLGMELGEEVAIRYLQDHGCLYTELGFTGFEFTKRNGKRIRVTPTQVIELN